jgi:hypothetical protein
MDVEGCNILETSVKQKQIFTFALAASLLDFLGIFLLYVELLFRLAVQVFLPQILVSCRLKCTELKKSPVDLVLLSEL